MVYLFAKGNAILLANISNTPLPTYCQPMDKFKFEQKMRAHLKASRYSQAALARSLHVDRSTVNKWIHGENQVPHEILYEISNLFGLGEEDSAELFHLLGYQRNAPVATISTTQKSYDAALYTRTLPPKKPDKLFGRRELFLYTRAQLEQGKHILLTGFGGTGKTALSATIAAGWIEENKGSVLWLGGDSENIDLLFEAIMSPFDAQDQLALKKGEAKIAAVQSVLAEAKVALVVLDNLSQVTILAQVRLAIPQGVPLLVTSRYDAANMDQCIKVTDLEPADGIALLAHHAQNARLSLAVYQEDSDSARLCERLAYHPLGIVIAGTWLKQNRRQSRDLLRHLDESNLTPLTIEMPPGARHPGHETVQAVLEQTFRQFNPQARLLFRAFGALPEPYATSELLACFVEENLLSVEISLDEVVSWNFADRDGSNFYSLHEIIHRYSMHLRARRPEPDRLAEVMQSYVNRYAQNFDNLAMNLSNIIRTAEGVDNPRLIELLRPLLLQGFCDVRGYRLELLALIDRMLAYLNGQVAAGQRDLHFFLSKRGNAHFNQREYAQAVVLYQAALPLAPDLERQVKLTALVAKSLAFDGQNEASHQHFTQAHALASDDDWLLSYVLEQQIHATGNQEDHITARKAAAQQVAINRRFMQTQPGHASQERLLRSLINLGTAELRMAQASPAEAQPTPEGAMRLTNVLALQEEAMRLTDGLDNQELEAHAFWALAEVCHALGDRAQAGDYLQNAYARYHALGISRDREEVGDFMQKHNYTLSEV